MTHLPQEDLLPDDGPVGAPVAPLDAPPARSWQPPLLGPAGRRPTLLDVARTAAVSRATASRVLAGESSVGVELARRVREAADQLGYRPVSAPASNPGGGARVPRRTMSGSIGVVVPSSELASFRGPFVGAPLQGASAVISAADRQPVLLLDDGRAPSPLVHYLEGGHVDAAIVILLHESELLYRALRGIGIPIVYVGRATDELGAESAWVDADNYGGARQATRALVEAGRRRLVIVTGPLGYLPAARRLAGFRDELADWGLQPCGVASGDFAMQSGSIAMANLLHQVPDADGVFACNDLMAAGVLRVLDAARRRVPEDVSVVAFDDTVVAATSTPALTSVHQPLREMGELAARIAVRALEGDDTAPRQIELPTTLTVRDST